jgi:hypothetical protein
MDETRRGRTTRRAFTSIVSSCSASSASDTIRSKNVLIDRGVTDNAFREVFAKSLLHVHLADMVERHLPLVSLARSFEVVDACAQTNSQPSLGLLTTAPRHDISNTTTFCSLQRRADTALLAHQFLLSSG